MSDLVSLLEQFVAFRSVAGNDEAKRACLDWIQETFLQKCMKDIVRGESEGAPYLYVPHPAAKLLWFAHIDVVPAAEELFVLRQEGDHAIGRGAKDMKGATLAFLLAFREACANRKLPPVSVLLTSDEETAGMTIPLLLQAGTFREPVAFTPDTGATPHIVTEHKGAVWADLTAHGKGAHAAAPWAGDNPIPRLAEALTTIAKHFPSGTTSDWQMTVSPTQIRGSEARNVIPTEAHCALDVRYPPEECATADEALERIRAVLPHGCTVTPVRVTAALQTDPGHPMVERIRTIAEEVLGTPVPIGREHGASDARYFGEHGIPAFLYGPEGGDLHGAHEWVSLPSLLAHTEINRRLLSSLER